MADFYIIEYAKLGMDAQGKMVLAGFEPALVEQPVISSPATSTLSAAFNDSTTFVMVHATAVGHVSFGTAPIAAITKGRIGAGETRFYAVQPGKNIKMAAINGT